MSRVYFLVHASDELDEKKENEEESRWKDIWAKIRGGFVYPPVGEPRSCLFLPMTLFDSIFFDFQSSMLHAPTFYH